MVASLLLRMAYTFDFSFYVTCVHVCKCLLVTPYSNDDEKLLIENGLHALENG